MFLQYLGILVHCASPGARQGVAAGESYGGRCIFLELSLLVLLVCCFPYFRQRCWLVKKQPYIKYSMWSCFGFPAGGKLKFGRIQFIQTFHIVCVKPLHFEQTTVIVLRRRTPLFEHVQLCRLIDMYMNMTFPQHYISILTEEMWRTIH